MDEESYMEFMEEHKDTLVDRFFKEHGRLGEMFDEFCFDEWVSYESSKSDYIRDIYSEVGYNVQEK